jgi:hypothetical protein
MEKAFIFLAKAIALSRESSVRTPKAIGLFMVEMNSKSFQSKLDI